MFEAGEMSFLSGETDAYGHAKLGGIGDLISAKVKELSPKYNDGKRVNIINQRLGYLVTGWRSRCDRFDCAHGVWEPGTGSHS